MADQIKQDKSGKGATRRYSLTRTGYICAKELNKNSNAMARKCHFYWPAVEIRGFYVTIVTIRGWIKKESFVCNSFFLMFTKILPGSKSIVVNSVVAEYKMPLSIYVVLLLLLINLIFCHRGWKTTFF